jgi:hypothetical protein
MKLILKTAALATAFALAACGGGTEGGNNASNGTEALGSDLNAAVSTIENVADNATGNTADALGNQADAVANAAETQAHDNTSNAAH